MESVDVPSETLRREVREGDIILPGDRINVVTDTGAAFSFRVVEITPDMIRGDGMEVAIDDVQSLEKRRLSLFRSAGMAAASAVGFVVLAMFTSPLG